MFLKVLHIFEGQSIVSTLFIISFDIGCFFGGYILRDDIGLLGRPLFHL